MLGVVLCALINSIGSVFLQKALEVISTSWQTGDWAAARPQILGLVTTLAAIYIIGNMSSLFWNRYMGVVTQGSLMKLREKMFNHMRTCRSATSTPTSAATSCRTTPTTSTPCAR